MNNRNCFRGKYLYAVAFFILLSLFVLILCLKSGISIGIAGEWQWKNVFNSRADGSVYAEVALLGCGVLVFTVLASVAFLRGRVRAGYTLCVLILLSAFPLGQVIIRSGEAGIGEYAMAVIDPFAGGYFLEGADIEDVHSYLCDFADAHAGTDGPFVHHLDVHPPGNAVFSHAMIRLAKKFGAIPCLEGYYFSDCRDFLLQTTQNEYFHGLLGGDWILTAIAMILLTFQIGLIAGSFWIFASTVLIFNHSCRNKLRYRFLIPLFAVIDLCVCLAPIVFLGIYDVLMFTIFCPVVFCLACALTAGRSRYVFAVLTGFLIASCMMFTLAFGSTVLFIGALLLFTDEKPMQERIRLCIAYAGGGFLLIVLTYLAGFDMYHAFTNLLTNDREFHIQAHRSFAAWWKYNALDLLMFAGPLPVLLAFAGVRETFRHGTHGKLGQGYFPLPNRGIIFLIPLLTLCLFLFLIFNPLTRGEAGRMFQFCIPLIALSAGMTVISNRSACAAGGIPLAVVAALAFLGDLYLITLIRNSLNLLLIY